MYVSENDFAVKSDSSKRECQQGEERERKKPKRPKKKAKLELIKHYPAC